MVTIRRFEEGSFAFNIMLAGAASVNMNATPFFVLPSWAGGVVDAAVSTAVRTTCHSA